MREVRVSIHGDPGRNPAHEWVVARTMSVFPAGAHASKGESEWSLRPRAGGKSGEAGGRRAGWPVPPGIYLPTMAASVKLLAALATLTWLKPQAVAVNSFTAHPSDRVVATDSARS